LVGWWASNRISFGSSKSVSEGVTRSLPGDAAERFFALGFALEQMHSNFKDLERYVAECAGTWKSSKRGESD
jgi:hypothetical protein